MDKSWLLSNVPQRRERLLNLAESRPSPMDFESPSPAADEPEMLESTGPLVTAKSDTEKPH